MQFLKVITAALVLLATPALAQVQAADPVFLQDVIQTLQAQRDQAMNAAAANGAQLLKAQRENAALQKKIDELKPKPAKTK